MPPGCCSFWALWLPLMLAVAAAKEHGEACSARKCGNTTISHPFWLPVWDTGRSCGSPEFEVSCRDNGTTPILLNSGAISLGFVIINIFYEEHSLHVVDRGKLELLHASSSCGLPMWNTSVKLGPRSRFRIAPVNMNLILYNCTKAAGAAALAQDRELVQTRMRCGDESEVFARAGGRYYETTNYGGGHEGCDAAVMPVLGTWAGEVNASDYERLISDGFLLTWQSPPTGARKMARVTILKIVGAGLGGAVLMACLGCFVWYKCKKRKQTVASNKFMRSGSSMTSYSKDLELDGSPHIFTFEELEVATDGFSASRELGDGGFGTVYKGKLKDGRVVAVKRLYKNNYRRVEQFLNEVDILSRLLHQNLVILYGCTSRMSRDLLLVYEFIANGTVADHLHGSRAAERGLTWPLRLNIAIETAEALAYLHAVEIIHRDVKTTNILLDNSFHVKVADFGLSRLFPLEVTHVSTVPQGTPGYVDPVYHQCYKLTDKSDVYSFGVVLVELISSKPAVDMSRSHSEINLANMALNRIQNHQVVQLVDPELGYNTDPETKRTIDRVAEVAFQCLQLERDLRPSIKEVVEILTCVRDGDGGDNSMNKKASQKEDVCLLKDGLQFSPDTVIHRFHSQSTNHSVASNASRLSNIKC
ncbi:unnamed protein product [Triticum turgidum subsp. durum]|uniref:non-specific serine/threonine protein kinase n=1 Tax=Triticum turgidum subsp. durum TaxID=4567 RepID=A0A9R1Q6L3_TRITD|nr:unnamed protein product [Triticum turgidum subsp. durum]